MSRPHARAFTLVELLVVIAIIGVLLLMLMPLGASAWQTALMTRCRTNLNRIYAAQAVWRADTQGSLLKGGGWMGRLLPYVEGDRSTFQCHARGVGGGSSESSLTSDPGSGGDAGTYGTPVPPREQVEASFEFYIYWQQGSYYNSPSDRRDSGSGIRGELSHIIPLSGDFLVRRTDMGGYVFYECDDADLRWGPSKPTYDDMKLEIHYRDGRPCKLKVLTVNLTGSNKNRFIIDLQLNGEVLVSHWVKHMGEEFDIDNPQDQWGAPGSGGGTGSGSGSGSGSSNSWFFVGDYGLSRGTYETIYQDVPEMDPRLFFVLDYFKAVADYTGSTDHDVWYKYFIEDPEAWERRFGGTDVGNWQDFQSLRHFGMANVLFGDGHIESLGARELDERDTRWCYKPAR